MQESPLKQNMIMTAEQSVLSMLSNIDLMLAAIQKHIHTSEVKTPSDQIVLDNIHIALGSLRSQPYMLADMVNRWKTGSPQILSKKGLELEVLNETMATLSATFCFLLKRNISTGDFKHGECQEAHKNLVACNRLLTEI